MRDEQSVWMREGAELDRKREPPADRGAPSGCKRQHLWIGDLAFLHSYFVAIPDLGVEDTGHAHRQVVGLAVSRRLEHAMPADLVHTETLRRKKRSEERRVGKQCRARASSPY